MKPYLLLLLLLLNCAIVQANPTQQVNNVLNQLHHAASVADGQAYFSVFAEDAVFIGTDASEVWRIEQFKRYAKPIFDAGRGWTYLCRQRHIYFSQDKQVAWFDEQLTNASYGETRGTGVLEKIDGEWKISQYHLAIPIPNALAGDITRLIKAHQASAQP